MARRAARAARGGWRHAGPSPSPDCGGGSVIVDRYRDAYLRLAGEAVSIYRKHGDPGGIPDALEELGTAHMFAAHYEAARASLHEARELHLSLGNRQKASQCTFALGLLALAEGQPDQARPLFENALETFKELNDTYWVAFTERWVGQVDRIEGNDETAEHQYRASLSAFRQLNNLIQMGWVLYAFADLALLRGQHARALHLPGASDALRERAGEVWSFGVTLVGDVAAAARDFLDASTAGGLYQQGRAMELKDAVAYALRQAT